MSFQGTFSDISAADTVGVASKHSSHHGEESHEKEGKKVPRKEKVLLKITSLERKLQTLRESVGADDKLSNKYSTTLFGVNLRCDKDVHVLVGPIIGKVTSTSAIVLVEVTLNVEISVHLIPRQPTHAVPVAKKQLVPRNRPKAFLLESLVPGTVYDVAIEGVNAKDAQERTGLVRTYVADSPRMHVVALSCDRPERLRDGETNMWNVLAKQVEAGEVDVVLHLGDQVYGQKEFEDAQAVLRYSGAPRGADAVSTDKAERKRLHKMIKERMRDIYRFTWNLPGTVTVLSRCSNLMIWSDNDIYNDFTIAKEEGHDGLEPVMIYLAQQVYREYQRQLWDVNYETEPTTDEFLYSKWGPTGVILIDMRGNRVTLKGEQRPENPLMNDAQWAMIKQALADPTLKNLFVCSEIPFVGNSPQEARDGATKPGLEFLVDHWAYNDVELVRLFELVFDWKAQNKEERDVVFVGGDIHVGVTSKIVDHKHGLEVVHLTATPISNHVCGFFPALEGKINDRFSYSHVPLKLCRNYAYMTAKVEGKHAHIDAKLIAGAPTKKH